MRLLLIDTCGSTGSLALAEGESVLRESILPARSASAYLVSAIGDELQALGWPLASLGLIAVVNGPGSFTGVRVGLAAAKGLCEAANLPLTTLSRLAVLLDVGAAEHGTLAVLDAGRGEFYVRQRGSDAEQLLSREEVAERAAGHPVLIAEDELLATLGDLQPRLISLHAGDALASALGEARAATTDVAGADANYVRQARTLYGKAANLPHASRA